MRGRGGGSMNSHCNTLHMLLVVAMVAAASKHSFTDELFNRPGRCPEIPEILKFVLKCPEIGVRS